MSDLRIALRTLAGRATLSDDEAPNPGTKRAIHCFTVLIAGLMAASLLAIAFCILDARRARTAPSKAVLIVSPQLLVADDLNTYEEAMGGRLIVRTYAEPSVTSFVRKLPGGAEFVRNRQMLLITPDSNGGSRAQSNPNQVDSGLQAMSAAVRAAKFPFIPIAFLTGILLGALLFPTNLSGVILACLALGAALYKATHACPVCPTDRIFGVPIELWAVGAYFAATAALIAWPSERVVAGLVGLGAGAIFGVQLYLFAQNRDLCLPCSLIALANGALLSTCAARLRVRDLRPSNLYARLSPPLACAGVLAAAQALAGQPINVAGNANLAAKPIPLRGKSLSAIHLVGHGRREAIFVVSDACHVCTSAKAWIAARPTLQLRVVRLLAPGTKPTSPNELGADSPLTGVPDLLFVDRGTIVSEFRGWSDDPTWQLSIERQINTFLDQRDNPKENP